MNTIKTKLVLVKDDHELLKKYVHARLDTISPESKIAEQLQEELKLALIVEKREDIPADVVRLNSEIIVEEKNTGRRFKFRLVLPHMADLNKERLSVFAPLGIALIGYSKGQEVSWQMPSGEKLFYIKEVNNSEHML